MDVRIFFFRFKPEMLNGLKLFGIAKLKKRVFGILQDEISALFQSHNHEKLILLTSWQLI